MKKKVPNNFDNKFTQTFIADSGNSKSRQGITRKPKWSLTLEDLLLFSQDKDSKQQLEQQQVSFRKNYENWARKK